MKRKTLHIAILALGALLSSTALAQKEWSMISNESWIQVYKSNMSNSTYKRIKVECTMDGTVDKLMSVLVNVENYKNWIYNTKNSRLIKKLSAYEYYYYTETFLPWPMQNRDAVVHIKINRNQKGLDIVAVGEPTYMPEVSGKVRVPRSANTWQVTQTAPNKLHIVYIFEADPGGNLSPWLVNSFVNKGPYESFRNLAEQMRN